MLLLVALVVLTAAGLAAAPPRFSKDLYPLLEKAGCHDCHNSNGVASPTRLHFPEAGASAAQIDSFGESLAPLIDRARPDQSLLLNKPTNRIPHTGGKRIVPGSPQEAALRAWVDYLATLPTDRIAKAQPAAAAELGTVLRRLTHSQYDNAVRDLLGDATGPARQFPPEDFVNGFKNQYQTQSISPLLAEAYSAAAEKLARAYAHPKCQPEPGCRDRFVRDFGLRAFRRPLTAEERSRYAVLYDRRGPHMVVETMLQSPNFLYWIDTTEAPAWKPYARASRLAFFLWDTAPDKALLDSAAAGGLNTPEGFERAARRMLEDPRARQGLDQFVSQWMRFDAVALMVKERRAFPSFTRETALAMAEETRAFIADLVWSDRNFLDFFTADYSFLNADLAAIYKVPAPATEFGRVSHPEGSERAGILGQGTFLALTSKPAETSITARGLFVREQFLCQHVPPPPPGVNSNLPAITEDKPLTNRDRLGVHLSSEACASCHNLIDPIGFGFEKFDAVGGRQEKARMSIRPFNRRDQVKTVELDLDTQGWIAGIADSRFSSPKELGRILAASPQCQECLVKQVFRYALGRPETAADRPVIGRVFAAFRDSQFRFKELMIGIMKSTAFPGS